MCTVVGSSMTPTLINGEKVIISNLFYEPKENDIIVFHQTGALNEPIVKRVIAPENRFIKIDYDKCIKCGLCSYVCPSRVEITEAVGKAKEAVLKANALKNARK